MSDLLAIVDPSGTHDALVEEIRRRHPDRVTLLVETDPSDWSADSLARSRTAARRLAVLRATIESSTGSVVVGLAWGRDQLAGWRFDRTIGGRRSPGGSTREAAPAT